MESPAATFLTKLSSTGRATRQKMREKIQELYTKLENEKRYHTPEESDMDKRIQSTIDYYRKEQQQQRDIRERKSNALEDERNAKIAKAEEEFEIEMQALLRKKETKIAKADADYKKKVEQLEYHCTNEVRRLDGLINDKETILFNDKQKRKPKTLYNAECILEQAKREYRSLFMGDPVPLPGDPEPVFQVTSTPALKPVKTIAKPSKQEIEEFIRNDPEEMELARMREDTRRQIERDARDRRLAEEAKREEDRKLYEAERRMQEEQEERRRQERLEAQPQPPSNTEVNSRTDQEDDQEEIEEDSDMEAQIAEAKARLYQQMKIRAS